MVVNWWNEPASWLLALIWNIVQPTQEMVSRAYIFLRKAAVL